MQFLFNTGVKESIASAQKQLEKMTPTDAAEKASLKKATGHLDEGVSALKTRQKHIKVADRSDYGWEYSSPLSEQPHRVGQRQRKRAPQS